LLFIRGLMGITL